MRFYMFYICFGTSNIRFHMFYMCFDAFIDLNSAPRSSHLRKMQPLKKKLVAYGANQ